MRTLRWIAAAIVVIVVLAVVFDISVYFTSGPSPFLAAGMIPAGDSFRTWARHSKTHGNSLYGYTVVKTSDDLPAPLRHLYHWSVEPPGPGYPVGAGHMEKDFVKLDKPGYVVLKARLFGKEESGMFEVLPRVVEWSVDPTALHLKIGEEQLLRFRTKLEGGYIPGGWSPTLWFPGVNGPRSFYGRSPYVTAERPYVPRTDEWVYHVKGISAGSTTITLQLAGREVRVPVVVSSEQAPVVSRPPTFAETLLANPAFKWTTQGFANGRLHYEAGSYAAQMLPLLTAMIDSARANVLKRTQIEDRDSLDLFFVESRAEMQKAVGSPVGGFTKSGERTAVFVYSATYAPFLAHELTHLYTHVTWGRPLNGNWISEGLATMAQGPCQGLEMWKVRRGLHEDGKLHSWNDLVRNFDSMDEIDANLEAAGILTEIVSVYGIASVHQLWKSEGWSEFEQMTGKSLAKMEENYRTMVPLAGGVQRVDRARLRANGCTAR